MTIRQEIMDPAEATLVDAATAAQQTIDLMLSVMSDGFDHPELWGLVPALVSENPFIPNALQQRSAMESSLRLRMQLQMLLGLSMAAAGAPLEALHALMPLGASESQNPQTQGVLFHLQGLLDPTNPKYQLVGKICETPFQQMDVLERSTHLCCASWMSRSAGDLSSNDWNDVWNSAAAQEIRASIHDGSYRYCNKGACPKIQSNALPLAAELSARSTDWSDIIASATTALPTGPETVNLAYDRTCNLSCPS